MGFGYWCVGDVVVVVIDGGGGGDLMGLLISDLMAFGGWCVAWWLCMVFVAGVVVGCRGCWGFNGF